MKNKLLTIAAFTLLLAGQSASASNNSEEFLSWLDNAGSETTQVDESRQFNKVSLRSENTNDAAYQAENDVFSIHYMSDK